MVFWVIVGAFVGIVLWHTDAAGFIFGGALAWLLWQVKYLQSQIKELSQQAGNETKKPLSGSPNSSEQVAQPDREPQPQINPIEIEQPAHYRGAPIRKDEAEIHADKRAESAHDAPYLWGSTDDWFDQASSKVSAMLTWFVSGNTLVRVGSIVLFFGAGFLLKYAAEHSQLSIEVRMAGVVALALMMLGAGWYLRVTRMVYALALQGGGLGLLYLTIFASFRLYDLLPASVALVLLAVVSGAGVALAVLYNARWLAILSFAGGFLAPILASTGTGSHVALFSWYAVLNVGIAVLAWFKAWRSLNLLGMTATFIIVTVWGGQYYQEAYFHSVEPFLLGFGLMYLMIGVLFTLHRADPEQEEFGKVDASIIFGTPVGFFLLQTPLVHHFEHGMSVSAALSGLVYLCAACLSYQQQNKTLMITLLSIGVTLLTLAIALEFDEAETAAAWAMEGVGLLWLGLRQKSSRALFTGIVLQGLAAGCWLWGSPLQSSASYGSGLSALLIAFSGWGCAWLLLRSEGWRNEHVNAKLYLPLNLEFMLQIWALLFWILAGVTELNRHFEGGEMVLATLLWVTVSAWWIEALSTRLHWDRLRDTNQWLVVVCWLGLLMQSEHMAHPSQGWGSAVWLSLFGTTGWMLYQYDKRSAAKKENSVRFNGLHIALACFIPVFIIDDMRWYVGDAFALVKNVELWKDLIVGVTLSLLLMVISVQTKYWPIRDKKISYLVGTGSIYVVVLTLWMFMMLGDPVDTGTLYLPLFNVLDITLILAGLGLYKWQEALQEQCMCWFEKRVFYGAVGVASFVWFNADVARVVHHYFSVPWQESAMFHAVELQAALSISWSTLALILMVLAGKQHQRYLWMVGAALLSIVVIKLFAVDMSGSGTLARIVSFLGVGGLFLIIGYFAPIPPVSKGMEDELTGNEQ